MSARQPMIVGLDITGLGVYPNQVNPTVITDVAHYLTIAQTAATALIDFVAIDDNRSATPRTASLDALSVASRLAPQVSGIGFAVTKSVHFSEPFTVSRELATLDFVSGGRAAWVVSAINDADTAQVFGQSDVPSAHDTDARMREYIDVSRKLWDSWEDDAVVMDAARGWYLNPHKLHHINHRGDYYAIRGPSITYRPPQGHVVVIHSDAYVSDVVAAVDDADVVVQHHATLAQAREVYAQQHARATAHGRAVRILQRVVPVVADTTSQAYARVAHLERTAVQTHTPLPRAQIMAGTVTQVADQLALWFHQRAADGFILQLPDVGTDHEYISYQLMPELQRRQLTRTASVPTATLREVLHLGRPANQYAGSPSEAFLAYESTGVQA